ncbi:hypothetical protein [Nannocystis pusilla]|uniref:hypothetical protein n=1 Tax=Nannocystis pusilla TaxID=889268 RepID=UPI003B7CD9BB
MSTRARVAAALLLLAACTDPPPASDSDGTSTSTTSTTSTSVDLTTTSSSTTTTTTSTTTEAPDPTTATTAAPTGCDAPPPCDTCTCEDNVFHCHCPELSPEAGYLDVDGVDYEIGEGDVVIPMTSSPARLFTASTPPTTIPATPRSCSSSTAAPACRPA